MTLRTVALDEVADLNPRLGEAVAATDTVAFVPMAAISAQTASVVTEESRTYAEVSKGFTPFLSGDVLVAKITPCFENGKIAQAVLSRRVGFGSTEFHVVRPHAGKLDARYVHHFLRLGTVRRAGERRMTGSGGQRRVPENYLAKLSIPLPQLAEQRRIAEVLDRAETLRAKRRAALAQLDSLTQSLFLDLFGDPVSNPLKWTQQNLETFFRFRTGKLDSNAAVASGQYPFFTCSRDDFRIDAFAFDCEALLLAGNNASADYSVKHYKGKFNAYQRTYVITLLDERNSYDFARFILEQRLGEMKRISKGTGTKYLTMELLNKIRVPIPPLDLQREFARRVAAVERLKTSQRAALAELDALFAALQHRAFRGEL